MARDHIIKCPHCGEDFYIERVHTEDMGDSIHMHFECFKCEGQWVEVYAITHSETRIEEYIGEKDGGFSC